MVVDSRNYCMYGVPVKKKILILCFFIVPMAAYTQRNVQNLIDSTLLCDYAKSYAEDVAGYVPDTVVYKGKRYLTAADLFAKGVQYFHVSGYPSAGEPCFWEKFGEIMETRRGSEKEKKMPDCFTGYVFDCGEDGYIRIGNESIALPPRSARFEPLVSLITVSVGHEYDYQSEYAALFESEYNYCFIPLMSDGDVKVNADRRNLISKNLYVARLFLPREAMTMPRIMDIRLLSSGWGKFDDPDAFARYLMRKAKGRFRGETAVVKIVLNKRGEASLVSCDNPVLAAFLGDAVSLLSPGMLTPYYEMFSAPVQLNIARIYPIHDYRVSFNETGKRVKVEFIGGNIGCGSEMVR